MRSIRTRGIVAWTLLAAIVCAVALSTAGCSYFVPSTKANVAPFADQTIAMTGEVDTSLAQGRIVYTRHLATGPEVMRYRALLKEFQDVVKGIVAYSFQVVTVAESGLPDTLKAAEMAKFLDGLRDRVEEHPSARFSLSEASIDTIIVNVRHADDLVGALRGAQPLADDAGHAAMAIIDELQEALDAAQNEMMDAINTRHGAMLTYSDSFKRQQGVVLGGLTAIDDYWKNRDRATLAALRDSLPYFFEGMPPTSQMTTGNVVEVEERLYGRLEKMDRLRQSMAWDVEMYYKQVTEIDTVAETSLKALRISRLAIHMWTKTHRKLSAGITTPAMFDMFEITKSLVGSVL